MASAWSGSGGMTEREKKRPEESGEEGWAQLWEIFFAWLLNLDLSRTMESHLRILVMGVRGQTFLWLLCGQWSGKGRMHSRCFISVSFSLGRPFLWEFMKY